MAGIYKNKDGEWEMTLKHDKTTPGTLRFSDGAFPHAKTLYFTKDECKEIGIGEGSTIKGIIRGGDKK